MKKNKGGNYMKRFLTVLLALVIVAIPINSYAIEQKWESEPVKNEQEGSDWMNHTVGGRGECLDTDEYNGTYKDYLDKRIEFKYIGGEIDTYSALIDGTSDVLAKNEEDDNHWKKVRRYQNTSPYYGDYNALTAQPTNGTSALSAYDRSVVKDMDGALFLNSKYNGIEDDKYNQLEHPISFTYKNVLLGSDNKKYSVSLTITPATLVERTNPLLSDKYYSNYDETKSSSGNFYRFQGGIAVGFMGLTHTNEVTGSLRTLRMQYKVYNCINYHTETKIIDENGSDILIGKNLNGEDVPLDHTLFYDNGVASGNQYQHEYVKLEDTNVYYYKPTNSSNRFYNMVIVPNELKDEAYGTETTEGYIEDFAGVGSHMQPEGNNCNISFISLGNGVNRGVSTLKLINKKTVNEGADYDDKPTANTSDKQLNDGNPTSSVGYPSTFTTQTGISWFNPVMPKITYVSEDENKGLVKDLADQEQSNENLLSDEYKDTFTFTPIVENKLKYLSEDLNAIQEQGEQDYFFKTDKNSPDGKNRPHPTGRGTLAKDGFAFSHWTADKDVELNILDDKNKNIIIASGEPISKEQLKLINAVEDIKFTAHFSDITLDTKARINGSQEVLENLDVVLKDTCHLTNLEVGKEYVIKGKQILKDTTETLKIADKEIIGETKFTAETSECDVEVEYSFNTKGLANKELVTFEYLYNSKDTLLVAHENLEDKEQTVKVLSVEIIPQTSNYSLLTMFWGVISFALLLIIAIWYSVERVIK